MVAQRGVGGLVVLRLWFSNNNTEPQKEACGCLYLRCLLKAEKEEEKEIRLCLEEFQQDSSASAAGRRTRLQPPLLEGHVFSLCCSPSPDWVLQVL